MKRFFCTICNEIKRVRRLPTDIPENLLSCDDIKMRKGTCRWHHSTSHGKSRATLMNHVRKLSGIGHTRKGRPPKKGKS